MVEELLTEKSKLLSLWHTNCFASWISLKSMKRASILFIFAALALPVLSLGVTILVSSTPYQAPAGGEFSAMF
jgi:hypothetical protein